MDPLKRKITEFLTAHGIDTKRKVYLACSGGMDSMVLLHLLLELKFRPALIHCNFKLRDVAADDDERLVRNAAEENDLSFHHRSFNTAKYAKEHGLSIQIAARELRYAYFNELIQGDPEAVVLLAHHADDSLETIILNLSRGSGLMPLSGIEPARGAYFRPLWLTSKSEIIAYAVKHKVKWREDMSNREDNYRRNFIRHHLVPPLKEAFPDFDQSFSHSLKRSMQDRRLFQKLIDDKLEGILEKTVDGTRFPLHHIHDHPLEISLVYHWLKRFGHFDFEAIESLINQPQSGRIVENGQWQLLVDRDYLILRRTEGVHTDELKISADQSEIHTPDFQLKLKLKKGSSPDKSLGGTTAQLDYDLLEFPLTLRPWQHGDRFIPLGMKGSKKVSDLLVDEKVNLFRKEHTWVLCSGGEICWVVGHRTDDRFKVSDKTKNLYFAQVTHENEDQ